MISFICLLFPAVISLWYFEKLTGRDLSGKEIFFRFCTNTFLINLLCLAVVRFAFPADVEAFYTPEASVTPETGIVYMTIALIFAVLLAAVFAYYTNRPQVVPEKKKKNRALFRAILKCTFVVVCTFSYFSAAWYTRVFGNVGFNAILYTLFSDLGGVSDNIMSSYLVKAGLPALGVSIAVIFLLLVNPLRLSITYDFPKKVRLFPLPRRFSTWCSALLSLALLMTAAVKVDFFTYAKFTLAPIIAKARSNVPDADLTVSADKFFETNYICPDDVEIEFPERKQNLIMIYLESMETSFLSAEYEGGNDVNPMPELCKLAEENINFSQNETVGGFSSPYGTTWTIAAMIATTTGIPLTLVTNDFGEEDFLPGAVTLSDVLHDNGYYQAFLCGSKASFGGRRTFFTSHGTDKIYDYDTAIEDGIIPADHYVWWGMEDFYLFDYAKEVLAGMSKQEKPFALTMLTADTHHIGGYLCDECEDEFPERYENVLACSSRQVYEFVNWIKEQDFYKDTTIVICGDHPTMDNEFYVNNITENYNRKVYNCFINSRVQTDNTKNREFTSFDMFPSILASLGCELEGNRLGLGVNLFSSLQTFSETIPFDELNNMVATKSEYYDQVILGKEVQSEE